MVKALRKEKVSGKLLDVGCGPGWFLKDLDKVFPSIEFTGCDLSERMVFHARNNLPSKVKVVAGDAQNLPFSDNSFDVVTSTLAFHHFPQPGKVISEFHRVLKPNGLMIVADARRDCNGFIWSLVRFLTKFIVPKALRFANEPMGSFHAALTVDESKTIMEKSAFINWEIKTSPAVMTIIARK
ncbi:MAG: class I SAM-dependent methyltransferase [Caldiserica bacterium]|nr:class I SAM-dependent methyltransferase [Caldisericota bacterium]